MMGQESYNKEVAGVRLRAIHRWDFKSLCLLETRIEAKMRGADNSKNVILNGYDDDGDGDGD